MQFGPCVSVVLLGEEAFVDLKVSLQGFLHCVKTVFECGCHPRVSWNVWKRDGLSEDSRCDFMLEINCSKHAKTAPVISSTSYQKRFSFKMCLWSWITAIFPAKKRTGNEYEYWIFFCNFSSVSLFSCVSHIQGEHKVFLWLQTFITKKLRGIKTYIYICIYIFSKCNSTQEVLFTTH